MTRSADNIDYLRWLGDLRLETIKTMFLDLGATEILWKQLPANANSKNQVYLASDLSDLSSLPSGEVEPVASMSRKRQAGAPIYRAAVDLRWIKSDGTLSPAPSTKFIFYPQYPEVRLSGFLQGASIAPGTLFNMTQRGQEPGRVLFLAAIGRTVAALVVPPESPAALELANLAPSGPTGLLRLPLSAVEAEPILLIGDLLCSVHRRGWIGSSRLDPRGQLVPCKGPNCGGNTLEAALGIRSNGFAAPDLLGWEIKSFSVRSILGEERALSPITLMTPEPDGGIYASEGPKRFLELFGYPDTRGRADRINFGGVYRHGGATHARTGVRMVVVGANSHGKIEADGSVCLLDAKDEVAASWSFHKLLDHWKAKHSKAAYVPCERHPDASTYRYSNNVMLGEGANFGLVAQALVSGRVYYDPGIKLEGTGPTSKLKRRSQFRVHVRDVASLYSSMRRQDACNLLQQ